MRAELFVQSKNVLIDGQLMSVRFAICCARAAGFLGSDEVLRRRMKRGIDSLARLIAPVDPTKSEKGKFARRCGHMAGRAEVAAAIAATESRRATISRLEKGADV